MKTTPKNILTALISTALLITSLSAFSCDCKTDVKAKKELRTAQKNGLGPGPASIRDNETPEAPNDQ